VTYHFRVHKEAHGVWAECLELEGCVTQGRGRAELETHMQEALNLYLEEPESSTAVFPQPATGPFGRDVAEVDVDPGVAFSMQLRQLRLRSKLTQKQAAQLLGMDSLYSYQRLERRSNPSLRTIRKITTLFPDFPLDLVLGGRPGPRRQPF
jgi:predicted RNase H-like HicB family nuclease/DNA-binding XRE family transcriptional regulator